MKSYTLLVLVALVGALHAHRIAREVPLSTGHYSARQEGDSFSKMNTGSDTATGLTKSAVEGILANVGKLRGATDANLASGGMGRGAYAGDMSGLGGLWSNTLSKAGLDGRNANAGLKGYLNRAGSSAGSVGAGANRR